MDVTRPVRYRGLLLTGAQGGPGGNNPIEGFRLTKARISDVSVHAYVEKRSADDGFDASDVFIGMRNVEMAGEVYAATKAVLFDLLDALRLKTTPTDAFAEAPYRQGYVPLSFEQPTKFTVYWPSGYSPRILYCRPTMQAAYDLNFQALGGRANDGYVVPFQMQLQAKDPRFYSPTPVVYSGLDATSGADVMRNRGNYPAPLNFTLVANRATDTVFSFVGMGTNMRVTIPGSPQESILRVDSEKKVVTLTVGGTERLRMDLIEFIAGTTWPKVPPTQEGASAAGYTWTSTAALDAASTMFHNEAWV